jgi:hypothetical protein
MSRSQTRIDQENWITASNSCNNWTSRLNRRVETQCAAKCTTQNSRYTLRRYRLLHLCRLRTRVGSGSRSGDLRDSGRCCTGRDSSQAGIRFGRPANEESRSFHAKKNLLSTTNRNRELLRRRCVFRQCKLISSRADTEAYELTFENFANFLSVGVHDWSAIGPSRVGCVKSDRAILRVGLRKGRK